MKKYHLSWSGGKDSTASIIIAHEKNIPIKSIDYCRIMYNQYIPADLPETFEYIERAINVFKSWGYAVNIIKPKNNALNLAYKKYKRSAKPGRNGKFYGATAFCRGHCCMTGEKMRELNNNKAPSIVGIASNETKRLLSLRNSGNISLLYKYGLSEKDAYNMCYKNNLLSPIYSVAGLSRSGCFFCPNANKKEINYIKKNHCKLYKLNMELVEMCDYDISGVMNNWIDEYKRR